MNPARFLKSALVVGACAAIVLSLAPSTSAFSPSPQRRTTVLLSGIDAAPGGFAAAAAAAARRTSHPRRRRRRRISPDEDPSSSSSVALRAFFGGGGKKKKRQEEVAPPPPSKPPLAPQISDERRRQLGIPDGEDEYDLGRALATNTDDTISKIVAGSFILVVIGLLVAGVVVPSITDYGEGVCSPIQNGGRC